MSSTSLRWQRAGVFGGFVLQGVAPLIVVLGLVSISPGNNYFYWIVTAFGYGMLGFASQAWLFVLSRRTDSLTGMRLVLRLFAVACVVLGVAYLGLLNELRIEHYRFALHFGLRRQVISYSLSMAGSFLAALGFWTAGAIETRASVADDVKLQLTETETIAQ